MRFIKFIQSYWYVLLLPLLFLACEDQTKVCDQTLRSDFKMNFRHDIDSTDSQIDTALPKCTIYALGKDSIYRKTRDVTYATLTLDPLHDTSAFYVQADSTSKADTLTLIYTRSPHFVSAGCGFTTFFGLTSVTCTHHSVDSLRLLQPQITTTNDTHVTLYF
ncbi:hypothetical protein DCM91_05685 [Chitinophaga costaii]|nr:DUF6452 family protein [Chitinophaga costaii]PUZ27704.1 hypothetical protein DCM91_05685 [Chitinophaga costaii]